jgi:TonB family protein
MPFRYHVGYLLLTWALTSPGLAADESLTGALAERGHPDTTVCSIESSNGLGQLFTIQFRTKRDSEADRQAAVAMLGLLAPALPASVRWVGFQASRRWQKCRQKEPGLVFWRDHDGNWRLIRASPVGYLTRVHETLDHHQRGSPVEAYVLFSLGVVEQRLRRFDSSVSRLERANFILEREGSDQHGIRPYILVPLIYHSVEAGDDDAVDAYLAALAPIVGDVQGDYLPLIKRPPRYPLGALSRRTTGHVMLEFTVDTQGRVRDPIIVEEHPQGVGFGAASIEAAREFRYIPKVVDGQFVPVTGVRNLIMFELQ